MIGHGDNSLEFYSQTKVFFEPWRRSFNVLSDKVSGYPFSLCTTLFSGEESVLFEVCDDNFLSHQEKGSPPIHDFGADQTLSGFFVYA